MAKWAAGAVFGTYATAAPGSFVRREESGAKSYALNVRKCIKFFKIFSINLILENVPTIFPFFEVISKILIRYGNIKGMADKADYYMNICLTLFNTSLLLGESC